MRCGHDLIIGGNFMLSEVTGTELDDDDEGDFDIYAMIRSKSCNKRTKKDNEFFARCFSFSCA